MKTPVVGPMIARLGRRPHYPAPAGRGWVYVEVEREIEFQTHKELVTWRGWVNSGELGGGRFSAWLTDELLERMRGAARVQRHVRRRRDPSADYTSELISALCGVLLAISA